MKNLLLFLAILVLPTLLIGQANIKVQSPNGGESWEVGKRYSITWTSNNVPNVTIKLKRTTTSGQGGWYPLASNVSNTGRFEYTVPGNMPTIGETYKVYVMTPDERIMDMTDGYFTLGQVNSSVRVISPNGGESWEVGKSYSITWTSNNVPKVTIKLKRTTTSGQGGWYPLASNVSNTGRFEYTVPSNMPMIGETYKVYVMTPDERAMDMTDGYFTLKDKPIDWNTMQITATGNYPRDREPGWSDECQGVATEGQNWYVSQKGALWKFPVSFDLNTGVSSSNPPAGVIRVPIPQNLKDMGYNHLGDVDYHKGYIYAPLEGSNAPRIVVFRATDLAFVAMSDELPQKNAPWCAIDPISGKLYTSPSPSAVFYAYQAQLDLDNKKLNLTMVVPLTIKEGNENYSISALQGVAFSAQTNLMYISSDKDGYRGLLVVNPKNGQIVYKYKVNYDPEVDLCPSCWGEELEGLTIWEFNHAPYPPNITGNLHLIMIDNLGRNDDDLFFMHFNVNVEQLKAKQ